MIQQTSVDVYNNIKNNGLLSSLRFKVYDVIYANGPITQGEVWSKFFQERQRHDIGPRFAELVKLGVIQQVGTRPCEYTGVESLTWSVTGELPKKLEKTKTMKQRLKDAEAFILTKGLATEYKQLSGNTVE